MTTHDIPVTFEGWKIDQPYSCPDFEVTAPNGARYWLHAVYLDDGSYDHDAALDRCRRFIALRMVREANMMGARVVVDVDEQVECSLRSFLRHNRHDMPPGDIVCILEALRLGKFFHGGGGAGGWWSIGNA